MPDNSLTLWHIDAEISGLLEYQSERMADADNPPAADELEALKGEIQRAMGNLVAKVVLAWWRSSACSAAATRPSRQRSAG